MPGIYQLLKSLNEQETAKVNDLILQERERDVLDEMLQMNNRIFPSSTVCKRLDMKASHLDKINSILFKKCLETVAGKDVYQQVQYLDQKTNLWNVSKRVLNFHELKVIRTSEDGAEKFKFYSFYFQWLITIPVALRDDAELYEMAGKVVEFCPPEKLPETELWIAITMLRKDINMAIAQATFNQPLVQQGIVQQLNALIQKATDLDSPQSIYRAKLAGMIFYNLIREFSRCKIYVSEINKLLIERQEAFTELDVLIAKQHYAQTLFFSSRFEEAFEMYGEIIKKVNINELARWYVLIAEYFQVCIVTGRLDIAEELCDKYFSKFFRDQNASFYLSSLIQCTKLLLHKGEFEDAKIKLDTLFKYISKTATLQFQFALRELTVAYYYLTQKYDKAIVNAEKNLKYMRSKKIHYLIPEYTFHSRLVKSLIRTKTKQIPLTEEDHYMMQMMQEGTMAQYGILLGRLAKQLGVTL